MNIEKTFLIVSTILVLVSCGTESTTGATEPENDAVSSEIVITQKQFNLGNMKMETFSEQSFDGVITVTGMIDVPVESKSIVSAYFGGYVKEIFLKQGQLVKKGQTLFILENPDYLQTQQDFLEAKSQLSYLKSDYERQKELSKDNISSQKSYLKAESEYKVTLARFESLKKKLGLMNVNPNNVEASNLRSTIAVTAPITGYITELSATKGMFLNPSDEALTILNTSDLHVELNVFEKQLGKIAVGQSVTFRLQDDDQTYNAKIEIINKSVDMEKRTVMVHCPVKMGEAPAKLIPGMYVEAAIVTSEGKALALPESAVVSLGNAFFVLMKKESSNGTLYFERKEVRVGQTKNGFIEILNADTFTKQTVFLTKGAFNLIQE